MYLFISLQTFAAKSVNFRNTSDVSSHKHGQSISMSYLARGTVKKWRLFWKSYKFLLVVFWGSSHSGSTMIGWLLDARAEWTSFNKFHWGCQTPGWRWPVVVSATPHLGGKAPVTIIIGCYYQVHSWNFNMKPENDDFQQGISNCRGPFSGSMWIFGAVEQFSGFAAILLRFWFIQFQALADPALVPAWKTPNIPFAARYLATPWVGLRKVQTHESALQPTWGIFDLELWVHLTGEDWRG